MLRKGAFILTLVLFAGCASVPPPPIEPVAQEPVVVPAEPAPVPAEPTPAPQIPAPKPVPPIAVVLSNDLPAYADVANELARHFPDQKTYDLGSTNQSPATVIRRINDSAPGVVIAIGLRAAQSSVEMAEHPVVFSQVFNYRHHELLRKNTRGIAVLPPLEAQIKAWKEMEPGVSRIGLIVGTGHDDLVTDAQIAAKQHGIELVVQVTHSDQETLYFFRRMIRGIDGFWLVPDNRILSSRVLQQMLADAKQRHVPVSVPSDTLLMQGAMISMTSEASDVAATIAKVIRKIQAGDIDRIPPITQLSAIRVKTRNTTQVVQR